MLFNRWQERLVIVALALFLSATLLTGFAMPQGGGNIPPHKYKGNKSSPPPKVETDVSNSHGG